MSSQTALIIAWPGAEPSIEYAGLRRSCEVFIWSVAALLCFWLTPSAAGQDIPTSLRFDDAIRLAETANPHYLAAQRGEGVFDAQVLRARARPNPEVILESENVYSLSQRGDSSPALAQWIALLGQKIETAGKRRYRVEAAEASLQVARAGIADVRRTLHVAVGVAYFSLARSESEFRAMNVAHDRIGTVIDLVAERVAEGDAAATELLRLQTEQVRLQDDMLQASLALGQAQIVLLSLIGASNVRQPVHAADSLEVATLVDPEGIPIATLDGVLHPMEAVQSAAMRYRPDLQAAAHEVDRALVNVSLQRALRIPNLKLAGGYRSDLNGNRLDAGIAVGLPLWGGLDGGGLAHAKAAHEELVAKLHQIGASVKTEVSLAVAAVNTAAERVRLIEQQYLVRVEDLQQRIQTAYTLGEASLTVLIDLQRNYLKALQLRDEAVYNYRVSQITLAAAMGVAPNHQSP